MKKCHDGRDTRNLRIQRNKYKRLYFKLKEERSKNQQNLPNQKIKNADSPNSINYDQANRIENDIYTINDEEQMTDDDLDIDYENLEEEDENQENEEDQDENQEKEEDQDDSILDLDNPNVREKIILDIFNNIGRGNGARFKNETKIYSYELYSKSPSAYKHLCKLFQFPSESTFDRKFSKNATFHKNALTNLDYLDYSKL